MLSVLRIVSSYKKQVGALSARIPQAPERYGFYVDAEEQELGDHGEPTNYRAALSNPEFNKWLEAMNAEMQSMKDNQVWNLVDLPPNYKTVGSKWLFEKKTGMDGNIHTYKPRLVAKGFTQTYGVDSEETFSPVADIKANRILIAIAAFYDYKIWQMDVKIAFLNGRLNEDVYMVQPEGFVNPKHPKRVCKLQISIYGLKQAFKSWNKRFDEEIKNCWENELSVKGYTNVSFQTDRDDTKSQSGYMFIMNSGAVAWRSSKQDTISIPSVDNNVNPLTKALSCDKLEFHVNGMELRFVGLEL
ncbi:retrotransposon protein, putative, ty1-copia subclass [Tanacetum coccineum]